MLIHFVVSVVYQVKTYFDNRVIQISSPKGYKIEFLFFMCDNRDQIEFLMVHLTW